MLHRFLAPCRQGCLLGDGRGVDSGRNRAERGSYRHAFLALSFVSALSLVTVSGPGAASGFPDPGSTVGWGANPFGQLGDGTSTGHTTAVPVVALTTVAALAAGAGHILALSADSQGEAPGSASQSAFAYPK